MEEDEFEWDDSKAADNMKKHGVEFGDASFVFDDQTAVFTFDHTTEDGEDRHKVTGLVSGRVLSVIFTERFERIRIIAYPYYIGEKATKHEERDYYNL